MCLFRRKEVPGKFIYNQNGSCGKIWKLSALNGDCWMKVINVDILL